MKTNKKRCDGCVSFLKIKKFNNASGLCEYHDSRCDGGFSCEHWKAPKFKRVKLKYKLTEGGGL